MFDAARAKATKMMDAMEVWLNNFKNGPTATLPEIRFQATKLIENYLQSGIPHKRQELEALTSELWTTKIDIPDHYEQWRHRLCHLLGDALEECGKRTEFSGIQDHDYNRILFYHGQAESLPSLQQ